MVEVIWAGVGSRGEERRRFIGSQNDPGQQRGGPPLRVSERAATRNLTVT